MITLSLPTRHGPAYVAVSLIPDMVVPIEGGTRLCFGARDLETSLTPDAAHKLFYQYDARAAKVQKILAEIFPGYAPGGYATGTGRICVSAPDTIEQDSGYYLEVDHMVSINYGVQIDTKNNVIYLVKEPYEVFVHHKKGRLFHSAIPRMEIEIDLRTMLKEKDPGFHDLLGINHHLPHWELHESFKIVGSSAFDAVVEGAVQDRTAALAMERANLEYEGRTRAAQLIKSGLVSIADATVLLAKTTLMAGALGADAAKDASRRVATGRAFLPTD